MALPFFTLFIFVLVFFLHPLRGLIDISQPYIIIIIIKSYIRFFFFFAGMDEVDEKGKRKSKVCFIFEDAWMTFGCI